MNRKVFHFNQLITALVMVVITAGCAAPAIEPTATAIPSPSSIPIDSPTEAVVETTPTPAPVADSNVLYQDDFTNPTTGWAEAKFDNYFIGYHEPEYYHVEIGSPNSKTTTFLPGKQIFSDATIEVKVLTNSKKTAAEGDFRYGPVFRRSGDQYYAFAISPRNKKWYVLKSSPNKLAVLTEGTDTSIHDLDIDDTLRVDVQGSTFFFHINDRLVGQLTDSEYTGGEVGFYVQTIDSPAVHVHFDELSIRKFEAPQPQQPQTAELYQDDFTNPTTGWAEAKFDNYFIGYHEPEYYHVEIGSPNSKTTTFLPGKQIFGDATIEVKVLTNSKKTAAEGDFRYGPVFRRSGDQYYAFAISPRNKKWYALKSTPNELLVLTEGTDTSIHDLDIDDTLRVDVQGSTFFFHINDHLVGQLTDSEYTSGEVGFYVQTVDSPAVHVHFDALNIWDFESPKTCNVLSISSKLNVRSGPGTTFASIASLSDGDTVEPLGRSLDGEWINIRVEGSDTQGWVANSDQFLSCNVDVNLLPIFGS